MTSQDDFHPLLLAFQLSMILITQGPDLSYDDVVDNPLINDALHHMLGHDLPDTMCEDLICALTIENCRHFTKAPNVNVIAGLVGMLTKNKRAPAYAGMLKVLNKFANDIDDDIDQYVSSFGDDYDDDDAYVARINEKRRRQTLKQFNAPFALDGEGYSALSQMAETAQARLDRLHVRPA